MKENDDLKRWEEKTLKPSLDRMGERKNDFKTTSGIDVPRVAVLGGVDNQEKLGFPGEYPFTRGIQPTMYRGKLWTMRQYAGYSSAKESNQRYRYLIDQGQTGLSVAFDLPTQLGYDADDPLAEGEIGKVGVSISSLSDMELLFKDIPLDKVSTSMTINSPAAIILAMYIAVAKKQGVSERFLRGTIQNDILKEYVARGTYIYPPGPSMRLITDTFKYCRQDVPKWNPISISGYHIREAGSNAVQEVAFTLTNAIAYVQAALDAGLGIDEFSSQLSFFFSSHNNFFEEAAKFRAARYLWATIMKERFGATQPQSLMMRFHTQTAGSTLTAQQPENNVVRVAMQALSAILGGTQSLHTNSMDEALGLPTEKSVLVALRTQQIIGYESGVADSIDPLAGSYLVEYLTEQITTRAKGYIERIDDIGGALAAIEKGFMQREIQEASYQYQRAVEENEQLVIGVNAFRSEEPDSIKKLVLDPGLEGEQKKQLSTLRMNRDASRTAELLTHLDRAARSGDNLMPIFITCAENNITLGEMSNTLRMCWGEYIPPAWK